MSGGMRGVKRREWKDGWSERRLWDGLERDGWSEWRLSDGLERCRGWAAVELGRWSCPVGW